ncbi:FAD-dependent monooxygenase [Natrinema sp. 1APR25-10V2]|uniref:FAD-dependent oxidoreductase n=1 Tax=Natrinema sp. 1APR25-10V2 TaxID=2951081 RepID=UPI00287618B5|nr:FAD-dependent monooxygenase [Natrinema sp. 1APR25-10V2]MDS0476903.1 FAD-dependent monooxygenase [Natrinema sp. 1APR25-10V2]
MTLTGVARYEPEQLSSVGDHAVVVGASMAGLCAARVLADGFEDVTVIERDPLPDEPVARRGVPQANHIHVLQEAGRATLTDLFPDFGENLLSNGGLVLDGTRDLKMYDEGDFNADSPHRIPVYSAIRPLYESIVRRSVTTLDNVQMRPECQFITFRTDEEVTAVEGVIVKPAGGQSEELPADLVIDTTGRTSHTPTWLKEHGYPSPPTDEVRINVTYSTTFIERPSDDRHGILVVPSAPRTRGGAFLPVENDQWQVTLFGMHGDHPPADLDGFQEYTASFPIPHHKRLLDEYPQITEEIVQYPFQSNMRRRYEDLDRFPDGLVVLGDAIASFNPLYGQGMSVAALEALEFHHALAAGGREDLPSRVFKRIKQTVDIAWSMAVGADVQFPQTEGPKPRSADVLNWYLTRLIRQAHTDGMLFDAFFRVQMMEQPPSSLFRPRIMWRVLRPTGG